MATLSDNPSLQLIADKVLNNKRISLDDGLLLYEKGDVGFLGVLANFIREKKNGNRTLKSKDISLGEKRESFGEIIGEKFVFLIYRCSK